MSLGIEELGALDDHKSSWEVDTPSKCGSCNQNLDLTVHEQVLTDLTVTTVETSVMHSNTKVECLFEILIRDVLNPTVELFVVALDKWRASTSLVLTESNEIECSKPCLPAAAYKQQYWLPF